MELEELFENVEDITDPSLMDSILARLEEIQSEDEEFMEILLKKQHRMVITWHQPWYQKTNSLTKAMPKEINPDQKDMFRTDSITYEESKKIHKTWKKFRKRFGVPNTPICLARWKNKDRCRSPSTAEECVRRFVISFLAQGLERNLYQVYKHVLTRYGGPVKGKYSKHEENMMKVCFYHYPKKAARYLTAVLSREPRGIYKRVSQMAHGNPVKQVKKKWTLPLASKFLKLLIEYTGETVVDNLKQRRFEKSIWLKLEKDMEQYYIYLQRFWHDKLHIQLFVKADVKTKRLIRKIFKVLKRYPYKVWTDIRWKQVAKHFPDGFSPTFLNKICYTFVYKSFPGFLKRPLEDLINHGMEKSKFFRNRRLKTLVLNENQELELIKYDNKLKLIF